MAEEQKKTAAYLPWATFKGALDQLAKGIPSRIDRSVFTGMAWNVQNQLFIALRFFGLLKGDDEPTPLLDDLVKGTEEERKAKFKKVAEAAYSELIEIDLTKATRAHFEDKLGELYNVTGDTRVKAVRFFLSAATYISLPVSTFIAPKDGKGGTPRRPRQTAPRARTVTKKTAGTIPTIHPAGEPEDKPSGTSKSVSLASGGTLTLSATLDLFALNSADRQFIFGIIDKLEEYEKASV
jgi:hypothetical protein